MPKQKRARGRPKKNWMEGIRKAMNERNLNEGQWEDRKQWSLGVRQRRKTFRNRYIYIYIYIYIVAMNENSSLGQGPHSTRSEWRYIDRFLLTRSWTCGLLINQSTAAFSEITVLHEIPCWLNLLKPTGYVMHHQQFNIQQLYALPTLYLCVLYLCENKQRLVPLTA